MRLIYQTMHQFQYWHLHQVRYYAAKNILKLSERGLWEDHFPEPDQALERSLQSGKPITVYAGFDPTADSLHVGNLLILTTLLHFQRVGHKVIALIGGATASIGDPSGRNSERPILEEQIIIDNSKSIRSMIENIFKNHEKFILKPEDNNVTPITILNNMNWHKKLNVVSFLREVGKPLRMGTLLNRTTIQTRLEAHKPLSFAEFSYQVLQAYDWLHLYRKYNCTVQIGGKDQLGNIISGHKLISRIEDGEVSGLTVPLIKNEAGDKFGKSAGNCIWLDPKKTSPFEFYQYFLRTPDSEIENLFNLLTFLPVSSIKHMMEVHRTKTEDTAPQKKLAKLMTLLVHGEDGLERARRTTQLLYGGNISILADMDADEITQIFGKQNLKSLLLEPGTTVLEASMKAGCFTNERDAFRIINEGGFFINLVAIKNPSLVLIPDAHILHNGLTLFRVGRKQHFIVNWL